jgi:hypothetical protein
MSRSRSRYIDIKYLDTRENIKRHKGSIEHIGTKLMIEDPMTKSLSVKKV